MWQNLHIWIDITTYYLAVSMCRDFVIILWPSQNIWNLPSKIFDGKTRIITKGCVNLITYFPFNSCGCIFGCRGSMLWNWRSGLHCRQIWPQNFTDIVQCFHGFTPGCSWNLFLLGWKSNLLWKWYPTFSGPKCMAQIFLIVIMYKLYHKIIFFCFRFGIWDLINGKIFWNYSSNRLMIVVMGL